MVRRFHGEILNSLAIGIELRMELGMQNSRDDKRRGKSASDLSLAAFASKRPHWPLVPSVCIDLAVRGRLLTLDAKCLPRSVALLHSTC